MRNQRSQQTVCFLIGPDHDRQDWAQFYEEAGYQVQVFKNPSVLFDYLKEFKPFVVVLETSALRVKLSQWVSELLSQHSDQIWMALAPIGQYPILSTYQNRGLKDYVSIDQPYFKERMLWALDRQLEITELTKSPVVRKFVDPAVVKSFSMEAYLDLQAREAWINKTPLTVIALQLDDQSEIRDFWGEEILAQSKALLISLCREKWNAENTHEWEGFVLSTTNLSTSVILSEVQKLQEQIQTQGRKKFGFQFSISAGLSELNIHSEQVQKCVKQATDACRNMLLKGGGRIGVPKPLQKDTRGDLPQDLG